MSKGLGGSNGALEGPNIPPPSPGGSELRIPSVSLSLSSGNPIPVPQQTPQGNSANVVVASASPGLSLRANPGRPGGVHLVPVSSLGSLNPPPPPPSSASFYKPVTITPAPSRLLSLGGSLSLSHAPPPPLRIPSAPPKTSLTPRTISLPYAPSPLPLNNSSLPVARVVPQPCLGATTMTLIPPMNLTQHRGNEEPPPARLISLNPPAVSVTPLPNPPPVPATINRPPNNIFPLHQHHLECGGGGGPKALPPPTHQILSTLKPTGNPLAPILQQPATIQQQPSARPGILRRREGDRSESNNNSSSNVSAVNNSTSISLAGGGVMSAASVPSGESHLSGDPREDESLSSGSTTLSATSSPGFGPAYLSGGEEGHSGGPGSHPPSGGSPRKKPRKQTFANINEERDHHQQHHQHQHTMNQHTQNAATHNSNNSRRVMREAPKKKQETPSEDDEYEELGGGKGGNRLSPPRDKSSLDFRRGGRLNQGHPPWPSRHNHFLRYSDVRVRSDRRPTVGELASHPWVAQQVNGWKLYHLSSQMEDIGSSEAELCRVLGDLQKRLQSSAHAEVNISGVLENIKANLQRSQIVRESVGESRESLLAIFEHKPRILDIINKYVNKRSSKRREVLLGGGSPANN